MTDILFLYSLYGIIIPGILVVLMFVAATLTTKYLFKKYASAISVFPIALALVVFLFLLFRFSSGYRYSLCGVLQHNDDRYITVGIVDDISEVHKPPFFYNSTDHSWYSGKLISIEGYQYYVPSDNIHVGDTIALEWGSDEKVAYKYSLNPILSETEKGTYPISTKTKTQQNITHGNTGKIISSVSFIVLCLLVPVQYIVGKKLSSYMAQQDKLIRGKIIPNKLGLSITLVPFLPVLSLTIGLALTGFKGVWLIFIMFACIWIYGIIRKLNTQLIFAQDTLTFKVFRTIGQVRIETIGNVYFKSSRFPYNRSLVISLQSGERIVFDQLDFWGLENAHVLLSSVNKS